MPVSLTTIGEDAGTPIEYTDAVYDEQSGRWASRAEVAEIAFTAFASKKKAEQVTGRLVVRRIPNLNPGAKNGQETLFDTWRFHAFFTTTDPGGPTPGRGQDPPRSRDHRTGPRRPKHAALAHLPSGKFTANAAWLVLAVMAVMAFNLTRAAATITGPRLAKGHHGDHPPQADHRPCTGRFLRPQGHPALPAH